MRRRDFLASLATGLPATLVDPNVARGVTASPSRRPHGAADVLVVGGGLGGCAAALSAAGAGQRVIMTEPTEWIGGQLTSQAVPPDENAWIETHGATASYQTFRRLVRDYYRQHYPLTETAQRDPHLNPGGGMVSRLCHEPHVALAVLYQMMAPVLSNGRLQIFLNHRPVKADVDHDRVHGVTCQDVRTGELLPLTAPWVIDATETGDLLPLCNTEYVTGFESQSVTGEPHAPSEPQPQNMQAVTWCFPMQYVPGADFTIDRPERYEFWRDFVPNLSPAWPGRLFDWSYSNPITLKPRRLEFDPAAEAAGWWRYRRIVDRAKFQPGFTPGSTTLVNWPQNDYLLGNFCEVSEAQLAGHRNDAKQLSLSLLYWMQTAAPRPDGGTGWPGLRLVPGIVGTRDGLAMAPYIRESRRISSLTTVVEQHVSAAARAEATGRPRSELRAKSYADSVGIGHYRIDLHPSTGGDNYIDLESLPFEIPLGALIPVRIRNLLAGAKNLGVTHITNGCYRLHPVEWNIGEAAGMLAAHCLTTGLTPHAVHADAQHVAAFQRRLERQGVRLRWPRTR